MSQNPPQAGPTANAPGYAYPYGYYPYPWYQPPVVLPPTPVERASNPQGVRLFNIVASVLIAAVTLGAVALASVAPSLVAHAPSPASLGFQQVYNQRLADDVGHWDLASRCSFDSVGLHAAGSDNGTSALCAFLPSANGDLTSQGFFLTVDVAPAADVSAMEEACITLSTGSQTDGLVFTQQGTYTAFAQSQNTCNAPSPLSLSDGVTSISASGNTIAWHTDALESDRISVWYSARNSLITVYVNDQQVLQETADISGEFSISLGAPANTEAIFTHFALYSGTNGAPVG